MFDTLLRTLRRLTGDRRGGTLVIFAVMAPIFLVLVLGVVDLYRLSVVKQHLQDLLDTATLIVARSTVTEDAKAEEVGDKAFVELTKNSEIKSPTSKFVLGKDDEVVGTASGQLTPMIVGIFTGGTLKSDVTTTVKRAAGSKLELAMVLDTTGSMAGQPLIDLKSAAKGLVQELHKDMKTAELVKIGIVPFGQYVNIGVSRRNEPWVSVPADWDQTVPAKCTTITTTRTCQKVTCTKYNDGKPYQSTCDTNCVTKPLNPPVQQCQAAYVSKHRFYGCIGSPAYPKNVQDQDANRVYPGYLDLGCGAEILPLTNNKGKLESTIAGLSASGYTYIPAGLAWGFNMLSKEKPLTEAEAYDPKGQNTNPRKALILMTDGENTVLMNHANGRHDKSPASGQLAVQANTYTKELCANIKAAKIEVYTVSFQLNNQVIKDILLACATDSEHYKDAANAEELKGAFQDIALSLRNLYISK